MNLIIDEGDTPGLNFQIITSNPDEALQLHQELMDISPYLSDTVIKSAIEKENVLLNAMIRDVLVSNPQAAKEPDIMEKLDDRLDPLPDYMMDEIIAGQQYYGAKELALQDLAAHKERMAESLSNCVWIIKQDTIASQVCDGLIVLLESIENIKDKYEMAFIHMSTKDTVSAISTLNDIPQEFSLNPQLQNEHESYLELFEILPVLLADSCIIDSSLFQRIFDIADVDNSLPGIYSRNLLETKSFLTYEEPVYLGNAQLKSNSIATSNNNYKDVNSPYLEIFPNPSNTFFIIKYDLKGYNSTGTLLISDQTGKILKNFSLNDPQNQKIIETNSFSSGIYHISLYVNKQLKAQAKLIIQ